MALGKHQRTESGRFRQERGDSLVKNLREEYPVLQKFHGSTKLETLRDEFNVTSLSQLIRKLNK